jgi:hypothetical protein
VVKGAGKDGMDLEVLKRWDRLIRDLFGYEIKRTGRKKTQKHPHEFKGLQSEECNISGLSGRY